MPEHIKNQLQKQIAELEHELAHELPAEIKKAVAMGDLSENAEYHMAKQRQEFVNARLGQLKRRMAELSLVNLAKRNLAQLTALVKTRLKRMQYRPALLEGFLASTGLDLTPFCNPRP